MESFSIAFNAVFPFIVYMAAGLFARQVHAASEETLNALTRLVFRLLLPILLFKNLYWASEADSFNPLFVITAVAAVLIVMALSILLVPRFVPGNPRRASIVQAIYRGNLALFAIPMGECIFGDASALAAVSIVAFVVPLYNVTATVILERYRAGSADPLALLKKIFTNPLIVGILTGFVFRLLKIPMASFVEKPVRALADCATPLAMLALGGTLHIDSLKKNLKAIVSVCGVRMVLLPAVAVLLTMPLPLFPCERFMIMMLFATPVATSSYPMAMGMGADGPLAGELVMASNVFSMPVLFVYIFLMSRLGVF